jgi:hypothetical protein
VSNGEIFGRFGVQMRATGEEQRGTYRDTIPREDLIQANPVEAGESASHSALVGQTVEDE